MSRNTQKPNYAEADSSIEEPYGTDEEEEYIPVQNEDEYDSSDIELMVDENINKRKRDPKASGSKAKKAKKTKNVTNASAIINEEVSEKITDLSSPLPNSTTSKSVSKQIGKENFLVKFSFKFKIFILNTL